MFCKAITTNGCPCTSNSRLNSNYCNTHYYMNKEDCNICMENTSCFAILPCKHSICMICVHKMCDNNGNFMCPFCRSSNTIGNLEFNYNNNKKFITKQDTNLHNEIILLIKKSINVEGQYDVKSIQEMMNIVFKNHLILFAFNKGFLVTVLKRKMQELSSYMNVNHYVKQLESYEQRQRMS